MNSRPPLIVTAALDEGAFAWFEDLRQTHFPVHRNRVPAHLTLFHALPGDEERPVLEAVTAACLRRPPIRMEVRGPWSLGRGVAYRLASTELAEVHDELARYFAQGLTPQDRAPFRPHITIQNKVEPDEARSLLERLQLEFEPFDAWAEGLLVWRYLGGPWEKIASVPFSRPPSPKGDANLPGGRDP